MPDETDVILIYKKEGAGDATELPVSNRDVLIGRAVECDIRLDDQLVSRFHASLKVSTDGIWITDMESTNGTLVDDQPLPPNRRTAIRPNQKIKIGSFIFEVKVPGAEPVIEPVEKDESAQGTVIMPSAKVVKTYDLKSLRENEFPQMKDHIHLDNAATAPIPQRTLKKMNWLLNGKLADTNWERGTFPVEMLGQFMGAAAKFLNAASLEEICITGGVSVANNHVAQSLSLQPGDNIILCDVEHPSNAYPWMSLKRDGVEIKLVPAQNGGLTLDAVKEAADDRTRLVAASAVQFFTGHRTDLEAIGSFCRERNIIFSVDAIQCIGHIPIDVQKMNIDILVTGGHKSIMAGPGVGFLYVREAVAAKLQPRIVTATSSISWFNYLKYDLTPRPAAGRFLIGTPNGLGVMAMIESLTLIEELTREAIDRHTTKLAAHALATAKARGYEITTTPGEHGSIATFKSKLDAEKTREILKKIEEEQKIAVGANPDRQDNLHIRLSFHCYNQEEDITPFFDAFDKVQ